MTERPRSRTYGTGTMTETSPGVWRLRVRVNGTQRSKTVKTAKRGGKTEATRALQAFRAELEQVRDPHGNATFRFLTEQWMPHARARLRPATMASYEAYLLARILPAIGDIKLRELTDSDCQPVLAGKT